MSIGLAHNLGHGLGTGLSLSAAALLAGGETNVIAASFLDNSIVIRDTVTSANAFNDAPFSKLTFTRASAASYFNSSGLLVSATIDTPRIDYDPVTLAVKGLLIEEARTNSTLRSEAFGTTWVPTTMTVGDNTGTGADGTTTADRLTATAGNALILQTVTTTVATWTFSVWLRRISGTGNVQISADGITWVTKALTSTLTRFSTSGTMIAGASTPGIRIVTSGDVIEAWGAQMELGAFATSYIPTTTVEVTRAADVCSIANTLFNLSQTAGTLYAKIMMRGIYSSTTSQLALTISDNTANERIRLRANNSIGGTNLSVVDGGATQADISITGAVINTLYKTAGVYAENDFHHCRNGTLAGSPDGSGTLPTTDRMHIGCLNSAGFELNGWISEFMYLPRRMTNAELQALTT